MLVVDILLASVRTIFSVIRVVADWWGRRRLGAAERVRHALAMKKEVAEHFPQVLPPKTNGDAIIRELRRNDLSKPR